MPVQSPYLIKRRIMEGNELWGVEIENQSKLFKMDIGDLLGLLVYWNRTVLVDIPNADKPSSLTVVQEKNGRFYFRTIRDKVIKNNFNKIPEIKLISCNKLKVLRK